MRRLTFVLAATVIAFAGFAGSVQAVPVVFFGEDLNPGLTVPPGGNAETARDDFLSLLTGVGTEDFENIALGTGAPLNISFPGSTGNITATINGTGVVENNAGGAGSGGNAFGRFNTTPGGSQYWEAAQAFSIDFSDPISAFGFYATDIGDFGGQVTLTASNGVITNFVIPNTVNGPNGSLLFWGFIDPDASYDSIAFGNTAPGTDFFGFDDMILGDRGQVIPEPGAVALYGLGLLVSGLYVGKRLKS